MTEKALEKLVKRADFLTDKKIVVAFLQIIVYNITN